MIRKTAMSSNDPAPLSHLVTCNPRTFNKNASRQRATVIDKVKTLLVFIHAPLEPPTYAIPLATCEPNEAYQQMM